MDAAAERSELLDECREAIAEETSVLRARRHR